MKLTKEQAEGMRAIIDRMVEKPKPTLADKIISRSESGFDCYYEKDIKQALKEYNEWLYEEPRSAIKICIKAKEIFGKQLLGE